MNGETDGEVAKTERDEELEKIEVEEMSFFTEEEESVVRELFDKITCEPDYEDLKQKTEVFKQKTLAVISSLIDDPEDEEEGQEVVRAATKDDEEQPFDEAGPTIDESFTFDERTTDMSLQANAFIAELEPLEPKPLMTTPPSQDQSPKEEQFVTDQ